jgi:hypothetical protein
MEQEKEKLLNLQADGQDDPENPGETQGQEDDSSALGDTEKGGGGSEAISQGSPDAADDGRRSEEAQEVQEGLEEAHEDQSSVVARGNPVLSELEALLAPIDDLSEGEA